MPTQRVPKNFSNGGQFTGKTNRPRKSRKQSAPPRNVAAEYENRRISRQMKQPRLPTSPLARRNRSRFYAEGHTEVERDLERQLAIVDAGVQDGTWTKEEAARERRGLRAMAKREHKEIPEYTPAPKAPKRAPVLTRLTSDIGLTFQPALSRDLGR